MAWTNNPYCTLADVKQALDPNLGSDDDQFIEGLITQAQATLDREIGFPFQTDGTTVSPTTRTFDGRGIGQLWIDNLLYLAPTAGVIEVQRNTVQSANSGTWQLGTTLSIDITADIVLKPNNGLPKYRLMRVSGLGFEEGLQNYQVTGVWGNPPMPGQPPANDQIYVGVPADVTRACIRIVTHFYKMRDSNYADMIMDGTLRLKYDKQLPADVVEVIDHYKQTYFFTQEV